MKRLFIVAGILILGSQAFANPSDNTGGNKMAGLTDAKNIHARALKDFQSRFSDASQVSWYSDDNGFTSYFTKDGYNDRVFYNRNGRWQYALLYYTQDKFPANLRSKVKSSYAGYNINVVLEVQTIYGIAYFVYIGNQSGLKILKMSTDGEMEAVTELARG